jgi:pyruvate/2-oxoglutarate dehydrogenase complex dihydrolipoamide acyltransferase (E2) component
VSVATAPAAAPAGSTGLCKDGSYISGASKKGACAGHKGVKEWYGAAAAAPAAASATAKAAPSAAATAAPAAAAAVVPAAKPAKTAPAAITAAAPGGGPGMVWVNKSTKAYHCSSDKYYGKTKDGAYLSESAAKAQGFHASHGKACQ